MHSVIDGLCEKTGVQYDPYARQLTLSEYTKLKAAIADTVKRESRREVDRQKVKHKSVKICEQLVRCNEPAYAVPRKASCSCKLGDGTA